MAEKKKFPKVVTPAGTAAYAWLKNPDSGKKFSDDKYKVTLVIDEDDAGIEALREKFIEAARIEWGKDVDVDELQMPLVTKDKEEFAGKVLIVAKSQFQPGFVDASKAKLADGVFPMSGDLIKLSAIAFPYEKTEKVKIKGKLVNDTVRGITLRLRGVQLLEKRSGGGSDVADDFDEEEGYESPASGGTAGGEDDDGDF